MDVLTYWRNHIWNEAEIKAPGQKLLLVDPYAPRVDNEPLFHYRQPDVDVKFIPRHCTGSVQPLDKDVIRSFKYRVTELMDNHDYENEEVTGEVLSNWIKEVWQAVLTTAIINSFNRLINNNEKIMNFE